MNPKRSKLKVCYVLSYKSPNYVRTGVLVNALTKIDWVELSQARNKHKSLLRYPESLIKLIRIRLTKRPNVYILGFRGHEIYWPVRLFTFPKPIIFDEFINSDDWLSKENKKSYIPQFIVSLVKAVSKSILKSAAVILADTQLDADSSARSHNIAKNKYQVVYVGTDEQLFKPIQTKTKNTTANFLNVLFYGTLVPLHGLRYILEAAKLLVNEPIKFTIVGGRGKSDQVNDITKFIDVNKLENVKHLEWMNYNDLPAAINNADVFMGGPFGNTSQSKRVITGKTFQSLNIGTTTMIGKINELDGFIDKKNCLLVEQGSAEAIADSLKWALNNRQKLKSIGQKGRELYLQKFSSAQTANKLATILEQFK